MRAIPWKLILWAAAIMLALYGANTALGYVPFTPQWNAKRAVAKADQLEGQVSTLEREATGNAEIGRAVETYHTQTVVIRDLTSQAETEARNAPDAQTPLSDERATRLRAADQRLCDATGLCGPAPAGAS